MADALTQIVDKLRDSNNILVTVNANPSVDELSAALGVTLLINKMNKHATAVFSGKAPSAIEFLQPEKTFEHTVDSLRDFIIALDKEKADHLRYKVVDDMVKIFITPYRTTISDKDLDFSQGDYNVEAVLAIGVRSEEDLDHALESHGRILHDATVAAISLGEPTKLGGIEWNNPRASSYSEVLYTLSEKLMSDKKLVDEQIATAFLTGIVAATDRFSNEKTSSSVMTIAAALMAAGANQQLIATKLQEGEEKDSTEVAPNDDALEDTSVKVSSMPNDSEKSAKKEKKKDDDGSIGTLAISHEPEGDVDEVRKIVDNSHSNEALDAAQDELSKRTVETETAQQQDAAELAERKLAEQLAATSLSEPEKPAVPSVADIQRDIARASNIPNDLPEPEPEITKEPVKMQLPDVVEPSLGGTLNATTEQAADDARKAIQDDKNRVILSHGGGEYASGEPATQTPLNATAAHVDAEPKVTDVFAQSSTTAPTDHVAAIQPPTPVEPKPTAPAPVVQDDARAAVEAALAATTTDSSATGVSAPAIPAIEPTPQSDDTSTLPPIPPMPPMPDFSTLPPLPGSDVTPAVSVPDTLQDTLPPIPQAETPATSATNDPAQFKIPGQ